MVQWRSLGQKSNPPPPFCPSNQLHQSQVGQEVNLWQEFKSCLATFLQAASRDLLSPLGRILASGGGGGATPIQQPSLRRRVEQVLPPPGKAFPLARPGLLHLLGQEEGTAGLPLLSCSRLPGEPCPRAASLVGRGQRCSLEPRFCRGQWAAGARGASGAALTPREGPSPEAAPPGSEGRRRLRGFPGSFPPVGRRLGRPFPRFRSPGRPARQAGPRTPHPPPRRDRHSRARLLVQHAGHRDAVEGLHLGQGGRQAPGRAQAGGLPAGRGQVAVGAQPGLQGSESCARGRPRPRQVRRAGKPLEPQPSRRSPPPLAAPGRREAPARTHLGVLLAQHRPCRAPREQRQQQQQRQQPGPAAHAGARPARSLPRPSPAPPPPPSAARCAPGRAGLGFRRGWPGLPPNGQRGRSGAPSLRAGRRRRSSGGLPSRGGHSRHGPDSSGGPAARPSAGWPGKPPRGPGEKRRRAVGPAGGGCGRALRGTHIQWASAPLSPHRSRSPAGAAAERLQLFVKLQFHLKFLGNEVNFTGQMQG